MTKIEQRELSDEILETIDTDQALNDLESDFMSFLQENTVPAVSDDLLGRLSIYTHEVRVRAVEIALRVVAEDAAIPAPTERVQSPRIRALSGQSGAFCVLSPERHTLCCEGLLVAWKPDEIIHHPDGSQEQRRWRRSLGRDGGRCLYIKHIDPDGMTREVWQIAWDGDGHEVERDCKYRREQQP